MDRKLIKQTDEYRWVIERSGKMLVDGVIFASAELIAALDVTGPARYMAIQPSVIDQPPRVSS